MVVSALVDKLSRKFDPGHETSLGHNRGGRDVLVIWGWIIHKSSLGWDEWDYSWVDKIKLAEIDLDNGEIHFFKLGYPLKPPKKEGDFVSWRKRSGGDIW